MILSRTMLAASALALGMPVVSALAATVMDFPDNAAMPGKAEIAAYSFRSAPPVSRQCTGAANSGSITITKPVDPMSAKLAETSAGKKPVVLLQIDDTKADGSRVAYRFTNATIGAIKTSGPAGKIVETVPVSYEKVQWVSVGCKPSASEQRRATNLNNNIGSSGSYGGGYKGY